MLCGRFGGTVGWGTPPRACSEWGAGGAKCGEDKGLRVGSWTQAHSPGCGTRGGQATSTAHGAMWLPPLPSCRGGVSPTLGLCWAGPRLAGTHGIEGHKRGSHGSVCGDVGWAVPNVPHPLCLGGAGLVPGRRWGREGVLSPVRIRPSVRSFTWSRPLAAAAARPPGGRVEQECSIPLEQP